MKLVENLPNIFKLRNYMLKQKMPFEIIQKAL